ERPTPPGPYVVPPEVLEEFLVGLGLLGDALHHDGDAFFRLGEWERLHFPWLGHAGNGIAVGTRGGPPGHLGQPLFDARGERMLEAMRFFVRVRPVEAERVGKPALEQAMAPGHDLRDLAPLLREDQRFARTNLDVASSRQSLDR